MADHITIGDVSPRIQYTGDAAQVAFTYPFAIFADADIEVYENAELKALTTDYTVTGAGNSAGGTVTFVTAPGSGVIVTLRRNIAVSRTTDFQESGEFRAKVINDELDKMTAQIQQVEDQTERSLRLAATDAAGALELPDKATRANKYLGFNANGDPIAADATGPTGATGATGSDGKYTAVGNGLEEETTAKIRVKADTGITLSASGVAVDVGTTAGKIVQLDGSAKLPAVDGSQLTGIAAGATAAEKANIMLNAFRISINGGLSLQNMVDGFVDEFEDETGVDAVTSTNEAYDGVTDSYTDAGDVQSVVFNGSSDYFSRGAGLTGAVDGGDFLFSVWINPSMADGTEKFIFGTDGTYCRRFTTNKIGVSMTKTVGGDAFGLTSTASLTQAGGWYHVIFSVDMTGGTMQCYINDASGHTVDLAPNGSLGWTEANWWIGTYNGLSSLFDGEMAEFYLTNEYLDLSVAANRRKFISASGKPVDLGADGSTPTGTAPLIYLSGAAASFATNKGSGGGMTENNAVTDGSDLPGPAVDMTLVSNAQTALAVPTDCFVTVWQEDVDAVTPNTDLTYEASRDGGATWSAVTLTEVVLLGTGRILTGSADISAQPSGTSMKYRIKTLNNKEQRLHGVALQWS